MWNVMCFLVSFFLAQNWLVTSSKLAVSPFSCGWKPKHSQSGKLTFGTNAFFHCLQMDVRLLHVQLCVGLYFNSPKQNKCHLGCISSWCNLFYFLFLSRSLFFFLSDKVSHEVLCRFSGVWSYSPEHLSWRQQNFFFSWRVFQLSFERLPQFLKLIDRPRC